MGMLDMINPTFMITARLVAYSVLIFFSFFIFVGVAVAKDKFEVLDKEYCPLYLDNNGNAPPEANCNYPMAISIMFQLLFLLFRVATLVLLFLGKFPNDFILFSDLFELVYVIVDFVAFFLTFIGACILSAGTNETCSNVRCSNFDSHSALKAAQAGAWISTIGWLLIAILGFINLWRQGKIPFLSSKPADQSGTGPATNTGNPPMDTPPTYPDDGPKY